MILFFTIPAMFFLLPNELKDFSKSIISNLFFLSNFYFHSVKEEYGASSNIEHPLLHTWSLSLEEQFYIIFPLLFFILFKFYNKIIIYFFLTLLVLSFVYWIFLSQYNYSLAFYSIFTRSWELLAGVILCLYKFFKKDFYKYRIYFSSYFGLFLFFVSFLFFYKFNIDQVIYLPVIILATVIMIFDERKNLINVILSYNPIVFIGLISYSLYLWHYPLLSFLKFTENYNLLAYIFILLILSLSSYFLIEKKFRDKKVNFKIVLIFTIVCFTLISVFLYFIFKTEIFTKKTFANLIFNSTEKPWNLLKDDNNSICFNNPNGCILNSDFDKTVHLIGDSHMGSISFDLNEKLKKNKIGFISNTIGGCIFFPGYNYIEVNKVSKECNDEYFSSLKKKIMNSNDTIFVIGGNFPLYLSGKIVVGYDSSGYRSLIDSDGRYRKSRSAYQKRAKTESIEDSFVKNLQILIDNGIKNKNKFIIIYPIPEMAFNIERKLKNLIRNNKFDIENDTLGISHKHYINRSKNTFKMLDNLKGENLYRIYPDNIFCEQNLCRGHSYKSRFYHDEEHLSLDGSKLLNLEIIDTVLSIIE